MLYCEVNMQSSHGNLSNEFYWLILEEAVSALFFMYFFVQSLNFYIMKQSLETHFLFLSILIAFCYQNQYHAQENVKKKKKDSISLIWLLLCNLVVLFIQMSSTKLIKIIQNLIGSLTLAAVVHHTHKSNNLPLFFLRVSKQRTLHNFTFQ